MPIRNCRVPVRELGAPLFVQVAELDEKIAELEKELRERAREDEQTMRLMSVPGIGPLCAMAIQAFAPPDGKFPVRPGLRGLVGFGSPAALDRWEAEAGEDIQDGSA